MKLAFIDYYLDEWHANHYPEWLRVASQGEMEIACAYGMIDSPHGGRTTAQWCEEMGIPRAATIEEAVAAADGVIVLSPDNCEMHEQLCQIPLRSGKPTYIDKTFAPDLATAKRIFALAEEHKTPCWSSSALRYAEEYRGLGTVEHIASWGPGDFDTYSIHQLEPVLMLMQAEPERVLAMKGQGWYELTVAFRDGRSASLTGCEAGEAFLMNVIGPEGQKLVEAKSDYFSVFMARLAEFFLHPDEAVPHAETLRIMAVREAGLKALEKPGEWIAL